MNAKIYEQTHSHSGRDWNFGALSVHLDLALPLDRCLDDLLKIPPVKFHLDRGIVNIEVRIDVVLLGDVAPPPTSATNDSGNNLAPNQGTLKILFPHFSRDTKRRSTKRKSDGCHREINRQVSFFYRMLQKIRSKEDLLLLLLLLCSFYPLLS